MYSRRLMQRFIRTFEPVTLDYTQLTSKQDISQQITSAFGSQGLGILSVSNIPEFNELRTEILNLGHTLANSPKSSLAKIERPDINYGMGWIHGREIFLGKQDFSKGAFQAYPFTDDVIQHSHQQSRNVWPRMTGFREAYRSMAELMLHIGGLLTWHLDSFISSRLPFYPNGLLENGILQNDAHVARLLNYYPLRSDDQQQWCGWHNDHCALTGLIPAMFFREGRQISPSELQNTEAGLYFRTRRNQIIKGKFRGDCMLFQIGEVSQIISGGMLQATPHAVRSDSKLQEVSRVSYALFMQPSSEFMLTNYGDPDQVFVEHEGVPSLHGRWSNNITFGEFHLSTIRAFY